VRNKYTHTQFRRFITQACVIHLSAIRIVDIIKQKNAIIAVVRSGPFPPVIGIIWPCLLLQSNWNAITTPRESPHENPQPKDQQRGILTFRRWRASLSPWLTSTTLLARKASCLNKL
jgi:hypothetical protein